MTFSTPSSLLQRLGQPSEVGSWERFVDLYTPLMFAWAARLRLSDHDAADLVQDVFAILVEKLPGWKYDGQRSFRAWLKTVLLNRWRELGRKRQEITRAGDDGALNEVAASADDFDLDDQEYRRQLSLRALDIMRADFEPATWQACWEFVVQGHRANVVAAELGITVNAVYLAKARVLRRLREELHNLLD